MVNVRSCHLFLAVSVQKQQCLQGHQGPQNHVVLYTNFSWLPIHEGFCFTHITGCLAAK